MPERKKSLRSVMKKAAFGILLLAAVFAAVLLVRQRKSELANMHAPKRVPMAVHLSTAEYGDLVISEHYLGRIEAVRRADISPMVTGHLIATAKDVGDLVAAGEVIARIDDRTLSRQKQAIAAELDGARTDLEQKKDEFERRELLYSKRHVSEEARDTAERAYLSAQAKVRRLEAELESAAVSLDYAVLKSPFDGVITARLKDAGDLAMAGQPVFTVEEPAAGFKILVNVPQETAGRVNPGARTTLTSGNRVIEAVIDRIHPAMQGRLATVEIRQNLPPFELPSGAAVGVDIVTGEIAGVRVPDRALLEYGGRAYVFRAEEDNRAEKIEVTVIGRQQELAVIKGPVSAGDRLVVGDESMLVQMGAHTRIRAAESWK